jgi:hypothetical protein
VARAIAQSGNILRAELKPRISLRPLGAEGDFPLSKIVAGVDG